jgi:hypothetical protein
MVAIPRGGWLEFIKPLGDPFPDSERTRAEGREANPLNALCRSRTVISVSFIDGSLPVTAGFHLSSK